jgi:hypothetical protein
VLLDCALAVSTARALDTQLEAQDGIRDAARGRPGERASSDAAPPAQSHVDAAALRIGAQRPSPLRGLPMQSRAEKRRAEAAASAPLLLEPGASRAARRPRVIPYAALCTQSGDDREGRIHSMERCAVAGPEAQPFMPHLFTSMYAETYPLDRFGVWGGQQVFRTLRGSVAVGFEAGAAIRVRERVNLTAGFRLLGYGSGETGPLEGGGIDPSITAPFLGLAFYY